jgi:hypothetical protein
MPEAIPGPEAHTDTAGPTAEPGPPPRPATPSENYPAGRLLLVNPGMPAQAVPEDFDFGEVASLIRHGGHVMIRAEPDGPVVGYLFRRTDPRMRRFEALTNAGRSSVTRTGRAIRRVAGTRTRVTIERAHTVHVHTSPSETGAF